MLPCSKKEEPATELIDEYSYEVECNYCGITYTDISNSTNTVKNNRGKWSYRLEGKIIFELKLSIITTLSIQQTIQAYVLKNKDVVFGNMGYNHATITNNTQKATGTANYGSYQPLSSGNGERMGGSSNGGNTPPTSTVCGVKIIH
ncbi:hypothetical protein FAZ19_07025 [Sphingobacterium alkalisoli]|uniref:Uncharacterized protein n=1 Tax=Sphingobacterium alkalisoli TaxID=1874115 RepID=A0A4U0H4M7_9SPHI|nr:hypothetical protein [Sphingobacterium alkalisoli]TJY66663.1 hypothetical protein FAZ19_07025 [Sphingobacterium alkalisoli]GGH14964.1 hypothetical protein GCM10011418_16300 [Sphingobacterium alkalisoli]